jgi:hypothetical protein
LSLPLGAATAITTNDNSHCPPLLNKDNSNVDFVFLLSSMVPPPSGILFDSKLTKKNN